MMLINNKKNNKKGISPLIATILVIGITVVIAVLITTWLRDATVGLQCNEDCKLQGGGVCQIAASNLDFSYNSATGQAVLVNSGSSDLTANIIWLNGAVSVDQNLNVSLDAYSSITYTTAETDDGVRAVVDYSAGLEGDCADTSCPAIVCWESDVISTV